MQACKSLLAKRLDVETVRRVESLLANGLTSTQIAADVGIAESSIRKIANGDHFHQRGSGGRGYVPTRAEIRAARRAIRSSWSPAERRLRYAWARSVTTADRELLQRLARTA